MNDNLDKLTPEQYTAKLNDINGALDQYKSKIADTEELAWIEHYSGQLDQLEDLQRLRVTDNSFSSCRKNPAAIFRKCRNYQPN